MNDEKEATPESSEPQTKEEASEPQEEKGPVVQMAAKALVQWKDDDGNITETEEVFRSIPALLRHLVTLVNKKERDLETQLSIVLPPEKIDGVAVKPDTELDGETLIAVVAEGTLAEVIAKLRVRYVTPQQAIQQLAALTAQLFDLSPLKGGIVTLIFGDAEPAGFGLVNETLEVTAEDLVMLGASATNQAASYKDNMRSQRGLKFPEDQSEGGLVDPRGQPLVGGKG